MIIDIFTSSNFVVDNGLLKQERDPAHKVSSEIGEVFQTKKPPRVDRGRSLQVGPSAPQNKPIPGSKPCCSSSACWVSLPCGCMASNPHETQLHLYRGVGIKSKGTAPPLSFVFFQNNLNAYLDFNSVNLNYQIRQLWQGRDSPLGRNDLLPLSLATSLHSWGKKVSFYPGKISARFNWLKAEKGLHVHMSANMTLSLFWDYQEKS